METIICTKPSIFARARRWYRLRKLGQLIDAARDELTVIQARIDSLQAVPWRVDLTEDAKREAHAELQMSRLESLHLRHRIDHLRTELRRIELGAV